RPRAARSREHRPPRFRRFHERTRPQDRPRTAPSALFRSREAHAFRARRDSRRHRHHSEPALKALIVDDERLARAELRRLLAAHPEVEIVGEAQNGEEALALTAKLAPGLIFLDVQMPGLGGFDVLERLDDMPQVIFTTAYDQYAIQAFEVSA